MNLTTRRATRAAIGFLGAWAMAAALAVSALASHVTPTTTVPDSVTAGEEMSIPVTLRAADGAPVAGTTVTFYLHASFAGVTGEAEIGRAVTDDTGLAALTYKPRLAGHHEIRMEYLAPGDDEIQVATTAFEATGDVQLYRTEPSVSVPGLDVGLLMAVVSTVWMILFGVALLLVAIARAGKPGDALSLESRG